jgi:hypothetical protein
MNLSDSLWGMGFVPQPSLLLRPLYAAPLMATSQSEVETFANKAVSVSIWGRTDSTIGQNGEVHVPSQFCPSDDASPEVGSVHRGLVSIREAEVGISEISAFQISQSQLGSFQVGTPEVRSTQIRAVAAGSNQVSPFQISSTQVSITQFGFTQVDATQVSITEPGSTQVDATQVSSTQTSFSQINLSEIPLTSSVSFQQLLSSQPVSEFPIVHTPTSNLIALNSTAVNLWQSFHPNFDLTL